MKIKLKKIFSLMLFLLNCIVFLYITKVTATNVEGENYDFIEGKAEGEEYGEIKLKIKLDAIGYIKEVVVYEHEHNEISDVAIQKLINNTLDKKSSNEIDVISGATETSNTYKKAIDDALKVESNISNEIIEKISLKSEDVINMINRAERTAESNSLKTGIGAYIKNQFSDADYNKNGNLVTHEYICAVLINANNSIFDVSFDHISSNISFDKNGNIPTGNARLYTFYSDKNREGANGLTSDGNYINILEFEKQVKSLKLFDEIKKRYGNNKIYTPFINALEKAIESARFIGATNTDTLGLSVYKSLDKKNIIDATSAENGLVVFKSNYLALTVNKEKMISSCMFDDVNNKVSITNNGKIFGSRDSIINSLNDLSNTNKYSKIDSDKYNLKIQYNIFSEMLSNMRIEDAISFISSNIDDNGKGKVDTNFANFTYIDFLDAVRLLGDAYIDARTITW